MTHAEPSMLPGDPEQPQTGGRGAEGAPGDGRPAGTEARPAASHYDEARSAASHYEPAGEGPPEQAGPAGDDALSQGSPRPAGGLGETAQRQAPLMDTGELESAAHRWKEIQAAFVDEPKAAVRDADTLVTELLQRLTQQFATEREQLEARWQTGGNTSTEELRQGLRRYRSYFEKLTAI